MPKTQIAPQSFSFKRSETAGRILVCNALGYVMGEYDENTGLTRWTRVVTAAQKETVQRWLLETYPVIAKPIVSARRKPARAAA